MNFLLPFKGIEKAKSRWGSQGVEHQEIVLELLNRNLDIVASVVGHSNTILVSPEASTAGYFPKYICLQSPGQGLNQDLEFARAELFDQLGDGGLAVLLPDLPTLTSKDIEALIAQSQSHQVVLCPDHEKVGTNALALNPANCLDYLFEGASFQRHSKAAREKKLSVGVLHTPGLAHDCDDIEALRKFSLI